MSTLPTVQVLFDPDETAPEGYALVSPTVLPLFAGHWREEGELHAGMWVCPFGGEREARSGLAELKRRGLAQ